MSLNYAIVTPCALRCTNTIHCKHPAFLFDTGQNSRHRIVPENKTPSVGNFACSKCHADFGVNCFREVEPAQQTLEETR